MIILTELSLDLNWVATKQTIADLVYCIPSKKSPYLSVKVFLNIALQNYVAIDWIQLLLFKAQRIFSQARYDF